MGLLSLPRELGDLNRLRKILAVLIRHGYKEHLAKAKLMHHATITSRLSFSSYQRTTAADVRETLEELGPTFVKLGQVLSLRPDLIPPAYCEEFKKLQDNVIPLEFDIIKKVIETELGRSIHTVFKSIDMKPLASASIAQVHKAILKDNRVVAVKVQRPEIRSLIEKDVDIMAYLARRLDNSEYSYLRASAIVNEFRQYTERELDFTFELRNIKKFHQHFKNSQSVVIPEAIEDLCTSKVLVLEFIDGIPLRDKARLVKEGFSLRELLKMEVRAVFEQVFILGVFHADPHPGNVFAIKKKGKQAIAFLDFGIVGFADETLRKNTARMLMALSQQKANEVVRIILEVSQKGPRCDVKELELAVASLLMDWSGSSAREEHMSTLVYKVMLEAMKHDVRVPANFVLIAKSFVTMEGAGAWLDPNLSIAETLAPMLKKFAREQYSVKNVKKELEEDARQIQEAARELPGLARTVLQKVKEGTITVHLDPQEMVEVESIYDLQTNENNLSLMCGALFVGSALLAALAPGLVILSIPVYWIGFLGVVLTGISYLRNRKKIHNYIDKYRSTGSGDMNG